MSVEELRQAGKDAESAKDYEKAMEYYQQAAEKGVALVAPHGADARYIAEAAGDAGVHFEDRSALLAALDGLIRPGDVVLVKASPGPNFVDIVAAIEALQ